MPTTSLGLRYPSSASAVDVPTDIGNLASDVDAQLVVINTFITRKDTVQKIVSTAASSAIGTTVTAVLTLAGCVFKAGRAYSVECIGGAFGDVDGRFADISFYYSSGGVLGVQQGAFYRTRCGSAGSQVNAYGKIYVLRSAGTDKTTDVALTFVSNAGTVTHDAGAGASSRPRALVIRDVGTAAQYSGFQDLT